MHEHKKLKHSNHTTGLLTLYQESLTLVFTFGSRSMQWIPAEALCVCTSLNYSILAFHTQF